MTSWRYVPHFFLFVLLIDLSKEDCVDYFDLSQSLAENLSKTFPLVKPKNTTDLLQYMFCTLEKSKDMDEKFPYILEHCFEEVNNPAEICSNETFGNISYYNLMCMTAATQKKAEPNACHLQDYVTLRKLFELQRDALPQTTLSPASPTSTSPTATTTTTTSSETTQNVLPTTKTTTATTTTTSSETTQNVLPTTKTTTATTTTTSSETTKTTTTSTMLSETTQNILPTTTTTTATTTTMLSETTQNMLPTTKTTTATTTTTTLSEITQNMLPTTKTTMLQKTTTRAPNKTPRSSPASAATTKTAAAQPSVGSGGNLKLCGPSPTTREDASPDNVLLKYLLLSMGLILLLLVTVYLYKRLRTRVRTLRENNAESYSLPLEPVMSPLNDQTFPDYTAENGLLH